MYTRHSESNTLPIWEKTCITSVSCPNSSAYLCKHGAGFLQVLQNEEEAPFLGGLVLVSPHKIFFEPHVHPQLYLYTSHTNPPDHHHPHVCICWFIHTLQSLGPSSHTQCSASFARKDASFGRILCLLQLSKARYDCEIAAHVEHSAQKRSDERRQCS